jgi:hypothetical protein
VVKYQGGEGVLISGEMPTSREKNRGEGSEGVEVAIMEVCCLQVSWCLRPPS